jgi:hypothetical protein
MPSIYCSVLMFCLGVTRCEFVSMTRSNGVALVHASAWMRCCFNLALIYTIMCLRSTIRWNYAGTCAAR